MTLRFPVSGTYKQCADEENAIFASNNRL
jgi:hypothetical protein